MDNYKDLVVLLSGAAHPLGQAIAQAFARQGAIIAANDINPLGLDETAAAVAAVGGRFQEYAQDVAKKMPVQAMIEHVLDDWGRIDILINNLHVEPHMSVEKMDEWDWHRTLDVNLTGPFLLIQSVSRHMVQRGNGVIINIGPALLHAAGDGLAAFASSKLGLAGLTYQAAHELAPAGVRVVQLNPGLLASSGPDLQPPAMSPDHPVTLEAVASWVVYLSSPSAANYVGQVVQLGPDPFVY